MRIAWLQRYRLLVVVYGLALVVGVREYLVSREAPAMMGPSGCEASAASCFAIPARAVPAEESAFWSSHSELLRIIDQLNPDDPDTEFLRGMQALADGDGEEFARRFETAVSTGVKHNHLLLQYYAQYLLNSGADWRLVNEAVNRWRENHPFSTERLSLLLGAGPRSRSEAATLENALARVSWIAGSELARYADGSGERWRVELSFRPGRPVDVREAMAAVTILSIPEEQRSLYEVTCETLVDCTATRTPRR